MSIPRPDLSTRPLQTTCKHKINATAKDVYSAWTTRFDSWFAQAGTVAMVPEPGRPYFFYNRDEWGRHPHYGRFLQLVENELIELTWMTGNGTPRGTQGAETLLRIELVSQSEVTEVHLTHSGFPSDESHAAHEENWPLALEILAAALA